MDDIEKEEFIKTHLIEYNDYNQSVEGIYNFALALRFDPKKNDYIPESLMKIPAKVFKKNDKTKKHLTPDGFIKRDINYSIVLEMKKHFNKKNGEDFNQIKKYDDVLIDVWDNCEIDNHDLVLLTHFLSSNIAVEEFENWKINNSFNRKFAIVHFNYSEMYRFSYTLTLHNGELSNKDLEKELKSIIQIPERIFLENRSKFKFYDAYPPLIYTMEVLYDQIIPLYFDENKYEDLSKGRYELTINEVRDKLQELFVSETLNVQKGNIPKSAWIKEALDKFVEIELARKLGGNKYILKYMSTKEDTKTFLLKRIYRFENKKKAKKISNEPTLFDRLKD